MKSILIAGLALALSAAAGAAEAADELWVITGGDGSALGYDQSSIAKVPAAGKTPATVSLRYGVFSTTPMATPPALAGSTLLGFVGTMSVNCQDKSVRPGEITYYFAGSGDRSIPADPRSTFEKLKPGDYRLYLADTACTGPKPADIYLAVGRTNGLAALRKIAATAHVTNTGAKGWTFALGDPARLLAIDTSSTKRTGDIVVQTEINWMRKPQVTNGEPWRYLQMTFEYDCGAAKRRGAGPLRIYADDDHPVHEETVANAPWEPLAGAQATQLLDIACKNKKLTGLPVGPRSAMLVRLKELNSMQ